MYSRVFLYIALSVAAIFTIMAFFVYGVGGFMRSTADYRGETEKKENVEANGDYRVEQHDYFYKQCSQIQSEQQRIQAYKGTGISKDKIVAMKTEVIDDANDYNAKAANDYTAGQFRDDELPYHIDPNKEVKSCGKP